MILKIKKRNGKFEDFDSNKIKIALQKTIASTNELISDKELNNIVAEVTSGIYSLGKNVVSTSEIDDIVEKILLDHKLNNTTKEYIKQSIKKIQLKSLLEPDINIINDWNISNNALEIVKERYLQPNETPLGMIRRVSRYFGRNKEEKDRFFELISNKRGIPSSPVLMNANTPLRMFSSCFTLNFEEDSLESIFDVVKQSAIISKFGGGIGFSFSNLREKGGRISSTGAGSSGIISWLKILNAVALEIKQGGRRRSANIGLLHILDNRTHPEILDFISLKQKDNISAFNLSIMVDNQFMYALEDNDDISLVSPHTKEIIRKVPAQQIFNLMAMSAHEVADPGLLFYDRINEDNYYSPDGLDLFMVNPCGEAPLLPKESCNLGSLNLANYQNDNQLFEDAKTMCLLLNRVLEKSKMPLKEIQKAMLSTRKIGIGVMGLADYFLKNNIPYDSEKAVSETSRLLSIIKKGAIEESQYLTCDYPELIDGRCNANLLSIAPTGTISLILNASSSIEPVFSWIYEHRILDGSIQLEINPVFAERFPDLDKETMKQIMIKGSIQDIDVFSNDEKRVFKTALDIKPEDRINISAAAQEIVDMAISGTVNLPEYATVEDIKRIFKLSWEKRLKGITVYRNFSKKDQPIQMGGCTTGTCEL